MAVSTNHEALHHLFRVAPQLLGETFNEMGVTIPELKEASLISNEATEIRPLVRSVDTVMRFDTVREGSFVALFESQLRFVKHKPHTWAYYLTYMAQHNSAPAVLIVLCQDQATADALRDQFDLGPLFWKTSLTIHVIAVGPGNYPAVTDYTDARSNIPRATLSAIIHAKSKDVDGILSALANALSHTDPETAVTFAGFTELGLGTLPAAEIWRNLMDVIELPFLRAESFQRRFAEGEARAAAKAKAEGIVESILEILAQRDIQISPEARARISSCTDIDSLKTWLDHSLTATTDVEIFG